MSVFADTILKQKYLWKENGETSWENVAHRVTKQVMKAAGHKMSSPVCKEIFEMIKERKFIPGGRYLYAAGRPYHQVQNCLLLRAEDSREGWGNLLDKSCVALATGAGIGVDYSEVRAEGRPIRKTGGVATGPLELAKALNEVGRAIMQGGSRRSAIWAGMSWKHPDVFKFITSKNWSEDVRKLKEKDFNFPATLDGTNISVQLDDEFFEAFHDDKHEQHALASGVYWTTVRQMLKTAEPGFSVDCGKNKGETLRNAPVSANTYVLLDTGYSRVGDIVEQNVNIWTGKRWANTKFKKTKESTDVVKVIMTGNREIVCDPTHEFILDTGERIQASKLLEDTSLKIELPNEEFSRETQKLPSDYYSLGYIYGDGSFISKRNAEATLCTEESKKCLGGMSHSLMSSVNKNDSRGFTRVYFKANDFFINRSKEIFPEELYIASSEAKVQFLAGLFDSDGNYFEVQNRVRLASKHYKFLEGCRRLLESVGILSGISTAGISTYGQSQGYMLTINTQYVTRFCRIIPTIRIKPKAYEAYRDTKIRVISIESAGQEDVYCCDVGYEEHSFMAEGIIISNCTELTSSDDSDICNIGSINMSRIDSLDEMRKVTELSTLFLLAGTLYSDLPYIKVDTIRTKNRRIGLGLMGLHEWLLKNKKPYGPDSDLEEYLKVYATSTKIAHKYSDALGISRSVKTRAIAPNGSIGILAETTTGIEPIYCAAYKRRYLKHNTWYHQFVLDPTAKRLVEKTGIDPDLIEDAYSLAENVERRMEFQSWMQKYVDHGISSTINLPAWGSEQNNDGTVIKFGTMLMKHLPNLRGITTYPDGARSGQPLTPVKYKDAIANIDKEIVEEAIDICDITGKGGSCGA